jgi:hypothetical protein
VAARLLSDAAEIEQPSTERRRASDLVDVYRASLHLRRRLTDPLVRKEGSDNEVPAIAGRVRGARRHRRVEGDPASQYGVALLGPFIGVVTEDGAAIVPKGWEALDDEETHFVVDASRA